MTRMKQIYILLYCSVHNNKTYFNPVVLKLVVDCEKVQQSKSRKSKMVISYKNMLRVQLLNLLSGLACEIGDGNLVAQP